MLNGYNGKILLVNLSDGSIKEEIIKEEIYRSFIGGQGLGVRILYEKMKMGADPMGPENILGFVVGLLTGSGIHGARYTVVAKSPVSGGWGDSNCGGSFAYELKAAGFDGVFFTGISFSHICSLFKNFLIVSSPQTQPVTEYLIYQLF